MGWEVALTNRVFPYQLISQNKICLLFNSSCHPTPGMSANISEAFSRASSSSRATSSSDQLGFVCKRQRFDGVNKRRPSLPLIPLILFHQNLAKLTETYRERRTNCIKWGLQWNRIFSYEERCRPDHSSIMGCSKPGYSVSRHPVHMRLFPAKHRWFCFNYADCWWWMTVLCNDLV